MGDSLTECMEIFSQDGVQLKTAQASFVNYLNLVGTLYITEYANSNCRRCLEWKPNDVTVDSDVQDQEWAVVNTVQKRSRTYSESLPPDSTIKPKLLKVNFVDIKSFKTSNKNRQLTLFDGKSEIMCCFMFQHGNCDYLITVLRGMLKTIPAKRDKHLFIVIHDESLEAAQLDKSFAELNIFQDPPPTLWKLVKSFHDRPYETTLETFAKVTDYVYRSPEQRDIDDDQRELLHRSLTEYASSHSQGDYEVIAKVPELPERKDYPRGRPLSAEQWKNLQNHEGKIEDVEQIKLMIFRGGVAPNLRYEVWKYLLDYFPWNSTQAERQKLLCEKNDEYYNMKLQWKRMTKVQEDNFSDYRERKNLIEKDVNRTDRTMDFYAGDNNPNLQLLYDILMTYIMYNFDLGYVQGMSDLLSPILHLLKNEVDAFWCFVGFMNKISSNFDIDQAGMKEQLQNLHTLLGFIEPQLVNYLDKHDSGNMFFCFRWLLVWFKRELSYDDVMRLWEVLWTGLPCENFHLLVCVAILETEKQALMENNYGFTEILKHINDLCGKLDVAAVLVKAEGIFHQIKEAEHLTDNIRMILGLPLVGVQQCPEEILSTSPDSPDEDLYERVYDSMQHVMT
ncbi:TBC1 domain family member 15 [Tribolium castaneum]|uniref:TBC1 domain family member 15 n=1 Tax=Tribolium castaneum TaxID=7070 RepID=D2A2J8_TRICA|nr:PREDICTED: TBC1 domain family member 15 [Tribolium castaneum]EFA02210.1 TBC1 domain family member 15-like Protein [Tribolium castaneum]|eukprot:XP_969840.1 PREDICTED: TBC1 domain family member 15 [Tribolium castaneum]